MTAAIRDATPDDAAAIAATLAPDLDFSPQSLALAVSAGELGPVLPVAQLALLLALRLTLASP